MVAETRDARCPAPLQLDIGEYGLPLPAAAAEKAMKSYLSFGGGRQTVALAVMACLGDLPMPNAAIYADPGWEPATHKYLRWFVPWAEKKGLRFIWVKPGNLRDDALDPAHRFASMPLFTKYPTGAIARLRRQCTREYKVEVVERAIRKDLGLAHGERCKQIVDLMIGFSLDEVHRCKDGRTKWMHNTFPLVEKQLTVTDCLRYLDKNKIERPPRSACVGCPNRTNAEWREMKAKRPLDWLDAVDFDKAVRDTRSEIKFPVYLHRSGLPLDKANLDEDQGDFWEGDCEGYCGH